MDVVTVMELLGSAVESTDGNAERRKRIWRSKHLPFPAVISELSLIEREATDLMVVRLIAMAKQVLTGKRTSEEFVALCNKVTGMV